MCACKKKHCSHHSDSAKKGGAPARRPRGVSQAGECSIEDDYSFKVAVPLAGGVLCNDFSCWEEFAILSVDNGEIQQKELLTPPFRETEILPRWLDNREVGLVIAGIMSGRALALFAGRAIDVITGAPGLPPEDLVERYLSGVLNTKTID